MSCTGTGNFLSYVNNLDPQNVSLRDALENTLLKVIPMFERVLTDLHRSNPLHQRIKGAYKYTEWEEPDPPEHSDDEEGWSTFERDVRHWIMHRPVQLPDVPDGGYPGGLENRKYRVSLCGRRLQLVIDVSDTRLVRHSSCRFEICT